MRPVRSARRARHSPDRGARGPAERTHATDVPGAEASAVSDEGRRSIAWRSAFLLALLLAVSVRVRLLDIPLERDEGEYAYAGQLMLDGIPPYAEAYNMKLPGTYAAYALIEAVFGQTIAGIHLGLLVVNAATSVLVFFLGRRLVGGDAAGCIAGSAYALSSLGPGVQGTSAHATHFVVLPALGGLLLLLRARGLRRTGPALFAAVLFGLAFVMKQQGIFFPAFAALCAAAWAWRDRETRRTLKLGRLVAFGLGLAAPLAITALLLWRAGVWRTCWFWCFRYAREYVTATSAAEGWANLRTQLPPVIGSAWPLWLLAGAGLLGLALGRPQVAGRALLLSFTAASALTVVPGLFFRAHYFVTLLPAVALLAAHGCTTVGRVARRFGRGRFATAAPAVAAVAALAGMVVEQRAFLFVLDPVQASKLLYDLEPFPEAVEIGRRLAARTAVSDRVAVLGAEPQIFFYSRRRSATGYIYVYAIWEQQRFAERMAAEMIGEIEAARPRYVVVEFVPPRLREWAERFLERSYELEGWVDFSRTRSEFHWDLAGRVPPAASARGIKVWRRRAEASP